jgi:hypothetical protein
MVTERGRTCYQDSDPESKQKQKTMNPTQKGQEKKS